MMQRPFPVVILCWAAIALVPCWFGCESASKELQATAEGQPVARVLAVKPTKKKLIRTIDLPGRLEPYEIAPLSSRVDGYVERVFVDVGDRVKGPTQDSPGTPLMEVLVPEMREELEQKRAMALQVKAEVERAEAAAKLARAAFASAEAHVAEVRASAAREESLLARWQSEYERVNKLADSGVVTRKVADETLSQRDAAAASKQEVQAKIASVEAQLQEAAAGVEKAQADIAADQAKLAVAEADYRRIASLLEFSTLRAPFDGIVTERKVHTGHLVSAKPGRDHELITVTRTDPLRVVIDIPEGDAVYVDVGTKVELRIPSLDKQVLESKITRSSWSLENSSRTLTAEIELPNRDLKLRPGLFVQAKVTVAEREEALVIPKTAIITLDKQSVCYGIGSDGTLQKRVVETGLESGTEIEIRSGLTESESIVGANVSAFREGRIVEIAPPPSPPK